MQASIRNVKERHEAQLMTIEGVVSVGLGQDDKGQAVILVGLDRERPEIRQQLPRCLEGYEVRTVVIGRIGTQ